MPTTPKRTPPRPRDAVSAHRDRQRARGFQRVEVRARGEDAPLVRAVAAALADPARAAEARALLRSRFAAEPTRDLKALIEAAPLDGIDLDRPRDLGRDVGL